MTNSQINGAPVIRQICIAVLLTSWVTPLNAAQPDDWPMFRGPGSRGVASGHPVRASWTVSDDGESSEGVKWQSNIPGLGHSSPVVSGDKIYVITAVAESGDAPLSVGRSGKPTAADDNGKQSWLILCYDKNNGAELWRRTAAEGKPKATRHAKATHANSSVTVSGDRLYAFLGSEGLHCYQVDGKQRRTVGRSCPTPSENRNRPN